MRFIFLFSIPVTISRDVLTDFIIPIIGFAITIGITVGNVRSVNNNTKEQIENQNKQTYRPRLKLAKIEKIPSEDIEDGQKIHAK